MWSQKTKQNHKKMTHNMNIVVEAKRMKTGMHHDMHLPPLARYVPLRAD